jgi:hypothetical protein
MFDFVKFHCAQYFDQLRIFFAQRLYAPRTRSLGAGRGGYNEDHAFYGYRTPI